MLTAAVDIDVMPGDGADHFQTTIDDGKVTDAKSDHDDDIFGDVLDSLKPEQATQDRSKDTEPHMKEPEKVASKTASEKKPIKNLRVAAPKADANLAKLIFPDDDEF